MATIKTVWRDLVKSQANGNEKPFTVKLDGWRAQLLVKISSGNGAVTVNGAVFLGSKAVPVIPVQPFVLRFGGCVRKGEPVNMDDQLTVAIVSKGTADISVVLVQEYFIPDRLGPDQTNYANEGRADIPKQANAGTGPVRPGIGPGPTRGGSGPSRTPGPGPSRRNLAGGFQYRIPD